MSCDRAIAGAGACGLAAARRLVELRHPDTVVLIDVSRIGHGISDRNAGSMLNHNSHGEIRDMETGHGIRRRRETGTVRRRPECGAATGEGGAVVTASL